jgi:hypothetical protein
MEWLTQSLPDVRDSEKPRMGSNDLAPCSTHHQTAAAAAEIYLFFLCITHTLAENIPRG